MPDPSPTTASIVQAFDDRHELLGPFEANWQEVCIAAALRALAARIHTLPAMVGAIRQDILDIAAELEAM
jgi:hypothetical protein